MIKVTEGGFQTLVVDLGRYGWFWHGLPPSGPIDHFSFLIGNILLGNDENVASLECCYTGPTLEIMEETCVAFTGADVDPMINGSVVPMWQVHRIRPGDVISFNYIKSGAFFYVSFSGGIDVPVMYGSRTTYVLGHLGGYEGRPLREGDFLRLLPPNTHLSKVMGIRLEDKYVPSFPEYNEIRVVFGLQGYLVSNVNEFYEVTWEMSTMGSRVGYRFLSEGFVYRWTRQERGEPQPFGAAEHPCDTILIPYPIGSIQTDMWNEAIVVLEDAISVGGFINLCTVIPCDLDTVGQVKPGDKVKFIPISREQALRARKERFELLNRIRESCLTF